MNSQTWYATCATAAVLVNVAQLLTTNELLPYGHVQTPANTTYTRLGGKLRYGGILMEKFYVEQDGSIKLKWGSTVCDILPYYALVDLTTGGAVWYRQTSDTAELSTLTSQIHSAGIVSAPPSFTAAWGLVATWYEVGFPGANTDGGQKRNTFQVALVTDAAGTESYAIFSYLKLQWTTMLGVSDGADPSTGVGGTSTAASYFRLPNGKVHTILYPLLKVDMSRLTEGSNTGTPGRWIYKISETTIKSGINKPTTSSSLSTTSTTDSPTPPKQPTKTFLKSTPAETNNNQNPGTAQKIVYTNSGMSKTLLGLILGGIVLVFVTAFGTVYCLERKQRDNEHPDAEQRATRHLQAEGNLDEPYAELKIKGKGITEASIQEDDDSR